MSSTAAAPLAARELPVLFDRVHRALVQRRDQIDDLNVFPVPDGDTGTNMVLTIRAGLEALHDARRMRRVRDVDDLATLVIRGVIRGARGNSGVIVSQVVRAVVEVVTGRDEIDAALYADALRHARDLAYEAVAHPVEGTMLSAIAAAADAASAAVADGADLLETSAAACRATARAVERTREQLDVLAEAGVVDAGARGFEVLLAAVHRHVSGEGLDVVVDAPRGLTTEGSGACHGSLAHPFEVQYLLDAPDAVAGELREELEGLGDSVVVVAAGGLLNVHVHTAAVGASIDAALAYGTPTRLEVVDLGDAIRSSSASRTGHAARGVAAVAVALGRRMHALLADFGVALVEHAGATPSVDDLVGAVESVAADRVLLFPGARQVTEVVRQAAELARTDGYRVEVLAEVDTPVAVLVAATVMDPAGDPDDVTADVRTAVEGLEVAEVVAAVADGGSTAGPVRAGELVVRVDGEARAVAGDLPEAAAVACDLLGAADAEVVTVLHGADSSFEERGDVDAVISERAPAAHVESLDAGVRPAVLWIGVE